MLRIRETGFTVEQVFDLRPLERERIAIYNFDFNRAWNTREKGFFEKINGESPSTFRNRFRNLGANAFESYNILVANEGETFTFGRFEGTTFIEHSFTANVRFYLHHPTARRVDREIIRTMNGYFEVKFGEIPFGFYLFNGGIVEFVGDEPLPQVELVGDEAKPQSNTPSIQNNNRDPIIIEIGDWN